jgi:hypothetical protein
LYDLFSGDFVIADFLDERSNLSEYVIAYLCVGESQVHTYPFAIKEKPIDEVVPVGGYLHVAVLVKVNPNELFFFASLFLRDNYQVGKDVDSYCHINAYSLAFVHEISS